MTHDREASRRATLEMLARCAQHQHNDPPGASDLPSPEAFLYETHEPPLRPSDSGIEGYYPLEGPA